MGKVVFPIGKYNKIQDKRVKSNDQEFACTMDINIHESLSNGYFNIFSIEIKQLPSI